MLPARSQAGTDLRYIGDAAARKPPPCPPSNGNCRTFRRATIHGLPPRQPPPTPPAQPQLPLLPQNADAQRPHSFMAFMPSWFKYMGINNLPATTPHFPYPPYPTPLHHVVATHPVAGRDGPALHRGLGRGVRDVAQAVPRLPHNATRPVAGRDGPALHRGLGRGIRDVAQAVPRLPQTFTCAVAGRDGPALRQQLRPHPNPPSCPS